MNVRETVKTEPSCWFIDPTKIAFSGLILAKFLKEQIEIGRKYIPEMQNISFYTSASDDTANITTFDTYVCFTNALVWRHCHGSVLGHFDVIGEVLGEGSYGIVKQVLGTLAFSEEGEVQWNTPREPLVIKFLKRVEERQTITETIQNEYELTNNIYPTKPPTFFSGECEYVAAMVMPAFGGKILQKVYEHERSLQIPTSAIRRFSQLNSAAISLDAIHDAEIVHRDIKPSNAFLTPDNEIKFFDFNLAKPLGKKDLTSCGSPIYMAPETLAELGTTQKSDVFGLGIIFGEGLGAEEHPALRIKGVTWNYVRAVANNRQFQNLFRGISFTELPRNYRREVSNLLSRMVMADQKKRISTKEVVVKTEQLLLALKLRTLSTAKHLVLIAANEAALILRDRLRQVAKTQLIVPADIAPMQLELLKALERIADCSLAVRELVDRLGIKLLKGARDKATINQRLIKLNDDHYRVTTQVQAFLEKIIHLQSSIEMLPQSAAREKLHEAAKAVFIKIWVLPYTRFHPCTLDEVMRLNIKYERHLPGFSAAFKRLEERFKELRMPFYEVPIRPVNVGLLFNSPMTNSSAVKSAAASSSPPRLSNAKGSLFDTPTSKKEPVPKRNIIGKIASKLKDLARPKR